MKRFVSLLVIFFFCMTTFLAPVAFAEEKKDDKLKSVEEEVSSPTTAETTASFDAKQVAAQSMLEVLIAFFLMGLSQTATENFSELYKDLKNEWSPVLPTVRVEPSYQYVNGGLNAVAGKIEAGYLIIGADGEYTRYFEKSPNKSLDIWDAHFLLRTIFTRHFGINLALGAKAVRGGQSHTGFDFGVPFYININNYFIFDIQPFMSTISNSNIYDLGAGVSFKYKLIGIRAGYRALFVGNEKLYGPRVGLFLQY